jgi:hypothetical protein
VKSRGVGYAIVLALLVGTACFDVFLFYNPNRLSDAFWAIFGTYYQDLTSEAVRP